MTPFLSFGVLIRSLPHRFTVIIILYNPMKYSTRPTKIQWLLFQSAQIARMQSFAFAISGRLIASMRRAAMLCQRAQTQAVGADFSIASSWRMDMHLRYVEFAVAMASAVQSIATGPTVNSSPLHAGIHSLVHHPSSSLKQRQDAGKSTGTVGPSKDAWLSCLRSGIPSNSAADLSFSNPCFHN